MGRKLTRREFIASTSLKLAGLGAVTTVISSVSEAQNVSSKSKVVVVRNQKAIDNRNICNPREVRLMMNKALFTLTGKKEEKEAWNSMGITAQDVIGIKVNCNSWTFLLNTHSELVYALCDSLKTVVKETNIIIYERRTSEMTRSGYTANKGATGVQCFGNDEGGGYDPTENLTRTITDNCTKIINFPSLKCVEGEFGGSLFLKNHIGSLRDDFMPRCHGNAEYCTEVCALPTIRKKNVLGICDGLRGTYKRGVPWYWSGIIMSRDQIAAEYTALTVLNEKRKLEGDSELEIPDNLKNAELKYRLGTCNPAQIEMVKIEM